MCLCVCECVCFSSVDLSKFEKAGAHPCIDLLKLAGPQYLFTRFLLTSRRHSIMEMGWACDWGNAKLVLWRCEGGMHWGDRYRGAGGGAHCFHAGLIGASVERPITGKKKQQYIIPLRQRLEVLRVRKCVWCMSDPGECNPIVLLWGDMMCVHISISAWAGLSVA